MFRRLRDPGPDDVVEVDRDDGSIARCTVTETVTLLKSAFPH